jgi:ABC-type oligopeptide transport system substrate-binding subunit
VARILFEGLTVPDPRTLEPLPGQAESWDVSPDGLTYTFHLRDGLRWTNGEPLAAEDFRYAWLRVLAPETAARNASLLFPIRNAQAFHEGRIEDPGEVGIRAPDAGTLVVTLESPTPYFLFLTQFYTYQPVPREAIERWGDRWTRPEHIVTNGPFRLAEWRPGDRFVFEKNPDYWDASNVRLDRIVAYAVDDLATSLNMYKAGVIDWNPSGYIPTPLHPYIRGHADYLTGPQQTTYFYSINVTRKPFDDPRVRRALSLAVDREAIARDLLKGARIPWARFAPTGYPGYEPPPPVPFDPGRARRLLAQAGYPGGKGFPGIEILFNTSEDHRRVAEAIQAMWRKELSIRVDLSNQEWGSYLKATTSLQYDVARRSWIGDYLDPSTFLNCYRTGDGNNRTGWSNPEYDRLLAEAAREADPDRRLDLLSRAEAILLEESPVIPIYHYQTNELVKPYVRGLHPTVLDTHPLKYVRIDRSFRPEAGAGSTARGADARDLAARRAGRRPGDTAG